MGRVVEFRRRIALRGYPGLPPSAHAGVGFLLGHPDGISVEVFQDFAAAKSTTTAARQLLARMDRWMADPVRRAPDKYHGWDADEFDGRYIACFVFKHNQRRLYGFRLNPDSADPRFQLFVPVHLAVKKEHGTDVSNLNRVLTVQATPEVVALFSSLPPNWREALR